MLVTIKCVLKLIVNCCGWKSYAFINYVCVKISADYYNKKMILEHPKCEIICDVLSNYSSFQYCDSNIGLFSIAPNLAASNFAMTKVIALNLFSSFFVLVLFFIDPNYLSLFLVEKVENIYIISELKSDNCIEGAIKK